MYNVSPLSTGRRTIADAGRRRDLVAVVAASWRIRRKCAAEAIAIPKTRWLRDLDIMLHPDWDDFTDRRAVLKFVRALGRC